MAKRKPQKRAAGRPQGSGNPARRSGGTARRPTSGRSASEPRRPLPAGNTFLTPNASPSRRWLERKSAPLLVLMHQAPRIVIALILLIPLAVGVVLTGVPALIAFAVALLLNGWLAYLSWPVLTGAQRLIRVVFLLLIVVLAVIRGLAG